MFICYRVSVNKVLYYSWARTRAGPNFLLGTLSTRIANLLCMTLVNVVT